jgi:hypothetical protein
MKIQLFSFFLLITFISCSYEQDSIYHPDPQYKPIVETKPTYTFEGSSLIVNGEVLKNGSTQILRFGHIWNTTNSIDFIGNKFSNFKEQKNSDQELTRIPFSSTMKFSELNSDLSLYIKSFAVNEIGISYGSTIEVLPDIEYSRQLLLIEQNTDNKITSGEKVTLRIFFKNKSPINCNSTKIESLIYDVNYLLSVEPRQNIVPYPTTKINYNGEYYFDTNITAASNAKGEFNMTIPIVSGTTGYRKNIITLIKIY